MMDGAGDQVAQGQQNQAALSAKWGKSSQSGWTVMITMQRYISDTWMKFQVKLGPM